MPISAVRTLQRGLWLALNDGVTRVEATSPLSHFDEAHGVANVVNTLVRHQGTLYAGMFSNLYRLEPDPEVPGEGAIAHFFLRHGLSDAEGGRIQDVGNDVIVLARGGSVLFIEGRSPQDVEAPTRVVEEAIELARLLSALLEDAYAEKVAEATTS